MEPLTLAHSHEVQEEYNTLRTAAFLIVLIKPDFVKESTVILGVIKWVCGILPFLLITNKSSKLTHRQFYVPEAENNGSFQGDTTAQEMGSRAKISRNVTERACTERYGDHRMPYGFSSSSIEDSPSGSGRSA